MSKDPNQILNESEERNLARWNREEALREAEVAYITDEQQRTEEWWWAHLCSERISLQDFVVRAKRGNWLRRREKYWKSVQQAILRESKNRAVKDRVRGLQEIQQVRDSTLEMIQPQVVDGQTYFKVQPTSYEGMVRAFVRVDEHLSAERDGILSMIEPEIAGEQAEQKTVFGHDELASMAETLLKMRHAKQQKRLDAHRTSDDTDD